MFAKLIQAGMVDLPTDMSLDCISSGYSPGRDCNSNGYTPCGNCISDGMNSAP